MQRFRFGPRIMSSVRTVCLLLCLPLTAASHATEDKLLLFHSDGCTLFPNGTPVQPKLWCACCVAHDLAYWQGGNKQDRLRADVDLHRCVKAVAGSDALGALMQAGVRAGGQPHLPSSFRWAYGWPRRTVYFELDEVDRARVKERLEQHPYAVELTRRCTPPLKLLLPMWDTMENPAPAR